MGVSKKRLIEPLIDASASKVSISSPTLNPASSSPPSSVGTYSLTDLSSTGESGLSTAASSTITTLPFDERLPLRELGAEGGPKWRDSDGSGGEPKWWLFCFLCAGSEPGKTSTWKSCSCKTSCPEAPALSRSFPSLLFWETSGFPTSNSRENNSSNSLLISALVSPDRAASPEASPPEGTNTDSSWAFSIRDCFSSTCCFNQDSYRRQHFLERLLFCLEP